MDPNSKPSFNFINLLSDLSNFAALNTAVKIGLFDFLGDDFKDIIDIKQSLDLKSPIRNICDFLDKLYLHKHLERQGILENSKYKNSHNYFISSNPDNILIFINMLDRINKRYENLDYILKNNEEPNKGNIFSNLYESNPDNAKAFLKAMSIIQKDNFIKISKNINFENYKTCTDIGGCLGAFSVHIKRENNHLDCITFDLPYVEDHAKRYIDEQGMTGKIKIQSGDMFSEDFPKSDVIAMGNILHDWNYEKKMSLIKKAYDALNNKGILIIIESFIEDDRNVLSPGINMSFNMLVECIDGYNMSRCDFNKYVSEVGFIKVEFLSESIGVDGAICYKN